MKQTDPNGMGPIGCLAAVFAILLVGMMFLLLVLSVVWLIQQVT